MCVHILYILYYVTYLREYDRSFPSRVSEKYLAVKKLPQIRSHIKPNINILIFSAYSSSQRTSTTMSWKTWTWARIISATAAVCPWRRVRYWYYICLLFVLFEPEKSITAFLGNVSAFSCYSYLCLFPCIYLCKFDIFFG